MADESNMFDPSMKKKKKKKKTPLELASAGDDDVAGTQPEQTNGEQAPAVAEPEPVPVDVETTPTTDDTTTFTPTQESDFDFSMKKKKKKKTPFDMDDMEEGLNEEGTSKMTEDVDENEEDDDQGDEDQGDEDLDFSFTGKKKKKKKVVLNELEDLEDLKNDEEDFDVNDDIQIIADDSVPTWIGSERDYTYDELLNRVFIIMREKNPLAGERKPFVMRPPEVVRVGTKKSSFVNFADICKALQRQPKHLLAFLLAELGTSGSLDGNNQLIIKGRFQQKQIEWVLRRYIKEYVMCHTCKSRDTVLEKDTRLFFLRCGTCQSRSSVVSIKSGFRAVTTKRAQIRAKAT